MTENAAEKQIIEYKSIWKDEFLAWICGYANANGGKLFIGKDDNGSVCGLSNSKKLMEDLPNKIITALGINADVNLYEASDGDFIEIVVKPFSVPVNYKGEYHYRSGSTKQALKGIALNDFIMKKLGIHWDGVVVPSVSITDLKKETLKFFIAKGLGSKRVDKNVANSPFEIILENLDFVEGKQLKRAAIMLFHPRPEKFVVGAYVKIGYFGRGEEVLYQDEVHGNLFEQIEGTMDLLFAKYIKALISYNGINRIETFEYPEACVREALLNALSHKRYSDGVPVQIRVYDDRIVVWNTGRLPDDWTIETLFAEHSSRPGNPGIANAFFRSGYVEAWGQGIAKMFRECENAGLPKPIIEFQGSDVKTVFRKDIYNEEYLRTLDINDRQIKALLFTKEHGAITNSNYQELCGVSRGTATNEIKMLVEAELFVASGQRGRGAKYTLR